MRYTFDQEKHIYKAGEEIWPGVTGLLKEFGLVDFSRVPEARLEYKRMLGIAVDYACDLLDQDNLDETSLHPDIIPYVEAYKKWKAVEKFEPNIEKSQAPMFSKKWRFGGRPDIVGYFIDRYDDRPCLIDRKCTFSMYQSTGPQLAGYSMLLEENHKIKPFKRIGLLLKKTGNYDPFEFKDPNDYQDFKACLWLHWQKINKYKTVANSLDKLPEISS